MLAVFKLLSKLGTSDFVHRVPSRLKILMVLLYMLSICMVLLSWTRSSYSHSSRLPALSPVGHEAYVTLITTDSYSPGVVALGRSIREVQSSTRDMVCLISNTVSVKVQNRLKEEGWIVTEVSTIDSPYPQTSSTQRFVGTFTKLHLWNMTQYDKILYLDADAILVRPVDELFLCNNFCATPNERKKGQFLFNSGVMVIKPSHDMFTFLMDGLTSLAFPSWDGADQGFLNSIFYWYCKGLLTPTATTTATETATTETTSTITVSASLSPAQLEEVEPENKQTSFRPPRLFPSALHYHRYHQHNHSHSTMCQSLPTAYNYRVNIREWRFYAPYIHTVPINIIQYTGSVKPWDCEGEKGGTWSGWLLCHSMYGRVFDDVMHGKYELFSTFVPYGTQEK